MPAKTTTATPAVSLEQKLKVAVDALIAAADELAQSDETASFNSYTTADYRIQFAGRQLYSVIHK